MESLKIVQKIAENHIPVIGMESDVESQIDTSTENVADEVALCAYYRAEARGYEPGYEIQDWLDAEAEIKAKTQTFRVKRHEYSV